MAKLLKDRSAKPSRKRRRKDWDYSNTTITRKHLTMPKPRRISLVTIADIVVKHDHVYAQRSWTFPIKKVHDGDHKYSLLSWDYRNNKTQPVDRTTQTVTGEERTHVLEIPDYLRDDDTEGLEEDSEVLKDTIQRQDSCSLNISSKVHITMESVIDGYEYHNPSCSNDLFDSDIKGKPLLGDFEAHTRTHGPNYSNSTTDVYIKSEPIAIHEKKLIDDPKLPYIYVEPTSLDLKDLIAINGTNVIDNPQVRSIIVKDFENHTDFSRNSTEFAIKVKHVFEEFNDHTITQATGAPNNTAESKAKQLGLYNGNRNSRIVEINEDLGYHIDVN